MSTPHDAPPPGDALELLAAVVVEDAEAESRRVQAKAEREARERLLAAEEHVEGIERAARELGAVRGRAVVVSVEKDADREIAAVHEGAAQRLVERFLARVRAAVEGWRRDPERLAPAIRAWARLAAHAMEGRPADAHAAPEDREQVYDALVEAGALDFQVHRDRSIRIGFVVRDLDGHTLFDARPEGLVAAHAAELEVLLRSRLPPLPEATRPAAHLAAERRP